MIKAKEFIRVVCGLPCCMAVKRGVGEKNKWVSVEEQKKQW